MPHLRIEHSSQIKLKKDFKTLVHDLHFTFAALETVKLEAVKTRTTASENVLVGNQTKSDFIFLEILLLKGRSEELKESFIKKMYEILKNHVFEESCCICVEVKELENYFTTR